MPDREILENLENGSSIFVHRSEITGSSSNTAWLCFAEKASAHKVNCARPSPDRVRNHNRTPVIPFSTMFAPRNRVVPTVAECRPAGSEITSAALPLRAKGSVRNSARPSPNTRHRSVPSSNPSRKDQKKWSGCSNPASRGSHKRGGETWGAVPTVVLTK